MKSLCLVVVLYQLFCLIHSIPIDNGVDGDPEITCGPRSISVKFNTEKPFDGKVYVKNHFGEEACVVNGGGDSSGEIELDFETCSVKRERSLNPRGIFVSANVIISFHRVFLTKIDRAVKIQCFYMEADKTVSQELEVSMLTTELQTQVVPMPICRYDILDGGPNGDPVKFAYIGQQVYHKWTCDSETVDTFCMIVYDCYVNDGAEDTITLLDSEGCALDQYLLGNLEYPTDLMAGREAHVFKFADRANLYFNCQIQITIKEPGDQCARPECRQTSSRRRTSSRRGFRRSKRSEAEDVVDVSVPHPMLVADLDFLDKEQAGNLAFVEALQEESQVLEYSRVAHLNDYCVTSSELLLVATLGAVFFVTSLSFILLIWCRMH